MKLVFFGSLQLLVPESLFDIFFWLVGLDVVLFLKVILMGSNALVLLLHPEALVSHPLSLFGQHHKFFRLT